MSAVDQAAKTQDANRALEDKAVEATTKDLKAAVAKLAGDASGRWVQAFGSLDAVADDHDKLENLVKVLKAHLTDAPTDVADTLRKALSDAHKLGQTHALAAFPSDVAKPHVAAITASATADVTKVETSARTKLDTAVGVLNDLRVGASFDDLSPVMMLAQSAVNAVRDGTTYYVNDATNDGVMSVANAAGVGLVFIAERDACLDCNAYAGRTSDDGFDSPPIHPNCRCITQPWSSSWATPGETSFPEALQREAERSVARGSSGFDSNAARVRAADNLLTKGTNLPKSVQAVAASAVKRGGFKK